MFRKYDISKAFIHPYNTLTTKLIGLRWCECSICEELVNCLYDYLPAQ